MLKILLALLVVSLTVALWLLTDTLSLPGWVAPWTTVVALVLLITLATVEILQRRRRRREQQRQAERSPFFVTLSNLRSRCEHAVEALRNQGAQDIPWVLLLGPPGAGKTAAVRSSGISFRDGFGPDRIIASGNVTPTENVQFLVSQQVAFLDTAGRYLCDTPDHDDRREWLELLTMLHNQRPGRPLAGVVLTLSATRLVSPDVDPTQLGHRLRCRLDDIQREFATSIPVYLLITCIDELAGMQRLFNSETSDRFGFSVELSGAGASKARRVAELPLAELALAIERRAFAHIERAATAEERGELYRAPAHFRRLVNNTAPLVGALFPDHGELDAPMWRGLYFASAGRAVPSPEADHELQQVARDYGDPPQTGVGPPPMMANAAFLRGLFGVELPADHWVAAWTRKHRGQQRFRHVLRVALLGAVALGGLILSLGSAESNHRLIGRTSAAIDALAGAPGPHNRLLRPQHLAPVQQIHSVLRGHHEHGAPWSLRFGLYQGDALLDDIERAYFTYARERLLTPLAARAHSQLERVHAQHRDGNTAIPIEQFWATTNALHLYLLLTRANTRSSVNLQDVSQQKWLSEQMPLVWKDAAGLNNQELIEARLVLAAYTIELVRRSTDLMERNGPLVDSVRQILRRTNRGEMWADELAKQPMPSASPITLSSFAGGAPWLVSRRNVRVEAAYTKRGWDQVSTQVLCPADPLERYIAAALVIDEYTCEVERDSLHREYFKRYSTAWANFISDVYVTEPEGYPDIATQIEAMTAPGGPNFNTLADFFKTVGDNIELSETPNLLGGIAPASATSPIAALQANFKAFYSYGRSAPGTDATPPVIAYINQLAKVAHPLGVYNKEHNLEELAQARQAAQQVYEMIYADLTQRDRRWVDSLEGLLEPPIRGLLDAVIRGALEEVSRRWCQEVVYPFDNMRTCYPFTANATCDVSRDEVAGLFQPANGKLWQLYNDALIQRFPFEGDKYVTVSQGYNSRHKLNPRVATFLTHARELHEVLFPHGSAGPTFAFSVQFKPMKSASSISFTVDGTTVRYNNNDLDRYQPLVWPGTGGNTGARADAIIKGGAATVGSDGDWGLFRLFEKSNVTRNIRLIVVKLLFNDSNDSAELRINPQEGAGNPLFGKNRPLAPGQQPLPLMGVFREDFLSPPRSLYNGGLVCEPYSAAAANSSIATPASTR